MPGLRKCVEDAAKRMRESLPEWGEPCAYVQLGTGFLPAGFFDRELGVMSMTEFGGFGSEASATGLPLTVTLGLCGEAQVLLGHGHRYRYEDPVGHAAVIPACAAVLAGVRNVILIESGFSLREDVKAGDWVAVTDYLNDMGYSPLAGNCDLADDVFLDMADAFSQALNSELINSMARVGLTLRLGTYRAATGPQFPSPAEAAGALTLGADLLGDGVVPETIAVSALGARVSALVLVGAMGPACGGKASRRGDLDDAADYFSGPLMRALRLAFSSGDLIG